MTDPYQVTIGGVLADPYRIARAYEITDPVLFQALKKLLRCGRKHKDCATDVREAITTLERWESMNAEDARGALCPDDKSYEASADEFEHLLIKKGLLVNHSEPETIHFHPQTNTPT